jgi:hypothetical protein
MTSSRTEITDTSLSLSHQEQPHADVVYSARTVAAIYEMVLRVAISNAFHTMNNSYYSTRVGGCQIEDREYTDAMIFTAKDVAFRS